jgi:endothelin-converting enzyme/putative endopeptidase
MERRWWVAIQSDDYCRIAKSNSSDKWKEYFTGIGFTKLDSVIVSQLEGLQTIFTENNVVAWKEYMKWNLLNSSTALLSTQID